MLLSLRVDLSGEELRRQIAADEEANEAIAAAAGRPSGGDELALALDLQIREHARQDPTLLGNLELEEQRLSARLQAARAAHARAQAAHARAQAAPAQEGVFIPEPRLIGVHEEPARAAPAADLDDQAAEEGSHHGRHTRAWQRQHHSNIDTIAAAEAAEVADASRFAYANFQHTLENPTDYSHFGARPDSLF